MCRKNKTTCGSTDVCEFWDYFELPEEEEEEEEEEENEEEDEEDKGEGEGAN
ncbi:hypothetical protein EYZ11_013588 [Aspergillus tanneri]|uniref:Uncharacterized protein n=1 Tax=Aspergillus tanneri TaxID=1220188 RepID=A0A4S3IXA6_9EURO|nr:hypothetical protein EYZ11_013588 [Aspergillus tanneri]